MVNDIIVPIKILDHANDLPIITYATDNSSGLDLMAALIDGDIVIKSGERSLIPTGISMALPQGFEAQIRPRSGLAYKHGITVLNSPGTIDTDYRGEIKVLLINLGEEDFIISHGMRIAQMVVTSFTQVKLNQVDDLSHTQRGEGGFGSTGMSAQKV